MTSPAKKKKHSRSFQHQWLADPAFKDWLIKDESDWSAVRIKCSICCETKQKNIFTTGWYEADDNFHLTYHSVSIASKGFPLLRIMTSYGIPNKAVSKKVPKFTELNNLVAANVGGQILFATDDFFAVAENLLQPEPPVWKEGVFTECGKWMDGWETRRKRKEGYDWAIIQLGVTGEIHGIDVDTLYFTGNYAPRCSIQAATLPKKHKARPERKIGTEASSEEYKQIKQLQSEKWEYLVPLSSLEAGYKSISHNYFTCQSKKIFTHIRLNIYPDGGIARLCVYGTACLNWEQISPAQTLDLVAMETGGVCLGYSDAHYGHPRNLIQPGRSRSMADGWETARKGNRPAVLQADRQGILQTAGIEWCVLKLGHPGIITKIEIDTSHFKGNFPDSCRIEACHIKDDNTESSPNQVSSQQAWKTLLPNTKLSAHKRLFIDASTIRTLGVISHIKFIISPDGGVSRLRLFGHKALSYTAKL